MTKAKHDFAADESVAQRLITGLAKIGIAMKSKAWRSAPGENLTPTQGQILVLLRDRGALRLSALTEALGVRAPTASDAVASLVDKKLVVRNADPSDGRAVALNLTRLGAEAADRAADWPDFLVKAAQSLSETEQRVFVRALTKMIRTLQADGDIPIQRMCVTCKYFQPNMHVDAEKPHHCAFVDAAFGDKHLRFDCADHEAAAIEQQNRQWARWSAPPDTHPT